MLNAMINNNGKKVSPESERYQECLFGYSGIVHTDICTFTLMFSNGNKSRAGQGPRDYVTRVSCILYIRNDKISILTHSLGA